MPSLTGEIVLDTPTLQTPKRPIVSSKMSTPTISTMLNVQSSPAGPVNSVPLPSSSSLPPSLTSLLELPSVSRTSVDHEVLQAVQSAVEVAPTVWQLMEEVLLGDGKSAEGEGARTDGINVREVMESLEDAKEITRRLTECVQMIRNANNRADVGTERKNLKEDAYLFLKSVVQLANTVKKYGGVPSSALRTNMVKLTHSAEEFAILLQFSSFSPSPTTQAASLSSNRPYSYTPMTSVTASTTSSASYTSYSQSQSNLLRLPEPSENQRLGLGPKLTRSQSARSPSTTTSTTSKLLSWPVVAEAPKSAQSLQTSKLPIIRRLKQRIAGLDPNINRFSIGNGHRLG
ncbi:hypothetical protein GYMLUDRAFT_49362 [Collybiopsis luxurians FD-317 M1]|uniref:Unplaced genomic scaffold GYMLUscaffold_82, whole genome shotgun sequence n=1 Tax=Collybiopsis luxurians FD-317 M1 TaxID=944289 RepID=A0A0D0C682_9AGAR|nr:hypothetical protein GYMLUDRAFT_49362 [Collybiopsis luxurians FD-317 M1]